MTEPLYTSPKLDDFLPSLVFPQNLPSCLCAHVLDPQPGEVVLDMCAAPGRYSSYQNHSHIGIIVIVTKVGVLKLIFWLLNVINKQFYFICQVLFYLISYSKKLSLLVTDLRNALYLHTDQKTLK